MCCCPDHSSRELYCDAIEESIAQCEHFMYTLDEYHGRFNELADSIYNGEAGSPCASMSAVRELLEALEKEISTDL